MPLPPQTPPVPKPVAERSAAPPVYKPGQTGNSGAQQIQRKVRLETRTAPPVYRPQALPAQAKATTLSVPPIYKPGQIKDLSAQLKPAGTFQLERRPAPAVYLPKQIQAEIQPKLINSLRVATTISRAKTNESNHHAASMPAGVVQRACLFSCCPWSSSKKTTSQTEGELEQLVPRSHSFEEKTIFLAEGKDRILKTGDKVSNSGVTSCGLVLAFGSDGILAYHWPFMSVQNLGHFRGLLSKIGTLNKIEIYTNKIPSSHKADYQLTLRNLRLHCTKKTRHYIYGKELVGDVTVILKDDGVESCDPPVTDELPPD